MKISEIEFNNYLTKSNLPASDYVMNPYIGCTHGCKYCYASFMKRFTGHKEDWGTFLDIKNVIKKLIQKKYLEKMYFYLLLLIVITNMKKNVVLLEVFQNNQFIQTVICLYPQNQN